MSSLTVFWGIFLAKYKMTFKLKEAWKEYFTKIEKQKSYNNKP